MGVVRKMRSRLSSARARALPTPERFPHLAAFLAGYLHQDFVVTHKTPAGALRAFLADASARERDALRQEWRQLLADLDGLAWREAARAFTALGGAWQPSSRRALLALFEQLT